MKTKVAIIILMLLASVTAYSQEAVVSATDSLKFSATGNPTPVEGYEQPSPSGGYEYIATAPLQPPQPLTVSPYFFDKNAMFPRIPNLYGYVSHESLPGLMGIESAALSYRLSAGNLTFTPSVYANKYGYFGGLSTNVGVGGELTYKIIDKCSLTVFGEYYTNALAANPSVMGYMASSRYGGYGTWHITNRWGLNLGAQRVYNSATGRWQTVPIVMPTFRISGNSTIGIDLGSVLYQVMEHGNGSNFSNPTIAPPRPEIPIHPRR